MRTKFAVAVTLHLAALAMCPQLVGASSGEHSSALNTKEISSAPQTTESSLPRRVSIPAGDLVSALNELAKQTGTDLVFRPDQLQGLKTPGVAGDLTVRQAISRLIEGTKLALSSDPSGALLIAMPLPAGGQRTSANLAVTPGDEAAYSGSESAQRAGSDLKLAQSASLSKAGHAADETSTPVSPDRSSENGSSRSAIQEIVVTAQKREERLQDVPVPVTAIDAQTLVETNQLRLQDYYTKAPGLNMTIDDFGAPQVNIRGLNTGTSSTATVGLVVDEMPYGATGSPYLPDFDPGDLQRVEVLRGPQGTLYGASSMGGLLKYVTTDPSTRETSGRVQVGSSSVKHGNGPGYNVRASINVPLGETFAFRASGFDREDPGYIDDPVTGVDGVNKSRTYGGRLSALWRPTDAFSLKLGALLQQARLEGSQNVDVEPGLGDLQQTGIRGFGGTDRRSQIYSALLAARLGNVDLTAASGYLTDDYHISFDGTGLFSAGVQQLLGMDGALNLLFGKNRRFTQEIRASGSAGRKIDWLIGAFYNDETHPGGQDISGADRFTGVQSTTDYFVAKGTGTFQEIAAFASLTVRFTDRFDVQIGGRQSKNKQESGPASLEGIQVTQIFKLPSPTIIPATTKEDDSFTYLLTPRFRLSPDAIVYARLASGYRPGGGVSKPSPASTCVLFDLPCEFDPDETQNYELGLKADVLNRTMSIDMSVFYIDWKDIQLYIIAPSGFSYNDNAGRAKSQGIELSTEYRPHAGLTISGWMSWNEAKLTENIPPARNIFGRSGERLPFSSRLSGHISIQQRIALSGDWAASLGGAISYVGEREGLFTATSVRQTLPSYTRADVNVALLKNSWTASLFVNNLTDKRGMLNGGIGTYQPNAFLYIQPRTVGLSIGKTF